MASAERAPEDTAIVAQQIGREPRGPWRVSTRCPHGYPNTIAVAPLLDDGTPFPTLYWLTCPFLLGEVARAESDGEVAEWAARLADDDEMTQRMRLAENQYKAMRLVEGEGLDPCSDVGIAGQADPCATKCLHAHVASFLAGVDDPVGFELVLSWGTDCGDRRCDRYVPRDTEAADE